MWSIASVVMKGSYKKKQRVASARLVKLQSVFFSQSLLHSWQGQEMGSNCLVTIYTAGDRDVPNFTTGPWHLKEQGRSRLFSSYICYAGQTLHEGNSCTTARVPDSVWAKHHRIIGASRNTVEQVHVTTATAKETSRTGFQLADRDNYGPWHWRSYFASNKAGESEDAVPRELCGAKTFWKHLGKVSFRVSRTAETCRTSVDRTSTLGTRKIATDVEWLRESENYVRRSTPPPSNLVAKC